MNIKINNNEELKALVSKRIDLADNLTKVLTKIEAFCEVTTFNALEKI